MIQIIFFILAQLTISNTYSRQEINLYPSQNQLKKCLSLVNSNYTDIGGNCNDTNCNTVATTFKNCMSAQSCSVYVEDLQSTNQQTLQNVFTCFTSCESLVTNVTQLNYEIKSIIDCFEASSRSEIIYFNLVLILHFLIQ